MQPENDGPLQDLHAVLRRCARAVEHAIAAGSPQAGRSAETLRLVLRLMGQQTATSAQGIGYLTEAAYILLQFDPDLTDDGGHLLALLEGATAAARALQARRVAAADQVIGGLPPPFRGGASGARPQGGGQRS